MRELLPPFLQDEPLTPIAAGQSGAAVYRVGERHVLKVSPSPRLELLKAASAAGVAPRVVHTDAARGAVVMERVDGSFPMLLARSRPAALELLGATLRRVHALPLPDGEPGDPRAVLAQHLALLPVLPAFTRAALERALAAPAPPRGPLVLSHNDLNPSNVAVDGERLVLLDWDTAGANDATWDLATVALFLRLDEPSCRALLAAHDGAPGAALPPRFVYERQLVGAMCGAMFLSLARAGGHPGGTDDPQQSLADFYARLRAGELQLSRPEGKWAMGLALVRESDRAL